MSQYETVKTICEKHGLNPEHVYFTDKLLTPYVYYDFPVFFELIMDEKYLKIFNRFEIYKGDFAQRSVALNRRDGGDSLLNNCPMGRCS